MMTERDICRGCQRGNPIAQRELFDRYSPVLMAVIYRYVSDDDDAKDVLQDTFIKAYDSIGRFAWGGDNSLRAWLTRIAVNTSLNHLRDNKRLTGSAVPVEMLGEPPDQEDDELSSDIKNLDVSTILELVAQLPDGYRTVFNMYCLDGYSHQEIAQQLGINEKSSSSQLARAKVLLARKIREYINEQNK